MAYLLAAFLLFCISAIRGCAQPPAQAQGIDRKKIDDIVKAQMRKRGIVGASLAIFDSNGIVYSKGYGFADKARGIAATATTVYPFGSISKVVTAAATLRLHDEGALHLDSAFTRYVPDLAMKHHFTASTPFTVADLLTHQAGMPRTRLKDLYTDHATLTDFYDLVKEENNDYLIAPPKTVYQYSDVGMTLLGVLPVRTLKINYTDFVRSRLFQPLGMVNASFHKDSCRTQYTQGYMKGKPSKVFATRFLPAFGLQASVEDMARFTGMFLRKGSAYTGAQVLAPATVARALSVQNANTQIVFSNTMGLGWMKRNFYGQETIYHGGEQTPCLSMIRFFPKCKMGLVLVSNSNLDGDFIADVVEDVLLELLRSRNLVADKSSYAEVPEDDKLYKALKSDLAGDYATSYGLISIDTPEKYARVHALSLGKKFKAHMRADSSLKLNYMLLGIIPIHAMNLFVKEVGGRQILGRTLLNGRRIFGGERMVFTKPATAWDGLSGTYIIANLSDTEYPLLKQVEVTEYKGVKVISGEGDIPDVEKFQFCIRPVSDSLAIVQGIGGQGLLGETVKRWTIGTNEYLEMAGYVLKKSRPTANK